ncbi:XRE family transcriptional regulator [Sphingobacterium puteale]|uniref:XRE family transcriptional regulator n=1 Tax=Sphingobacterium puteale TaxID=2420510 RepID=UPI003D958824
MKDAKVFFHSNLKLLRIRRKISQEQQAKLLGFTRSKLTAFETGQTGNPALCDVIKIAEHFRISVDDLLKSDLSTWNESDLRKLETGNVEYVSGKKLRLLAVTINPDNKQNLEYVPVKAKAGYLAGHTDPSFIASLPKFSLPELPDATLRMFPIVGDSMLPIPSGSKVICRYIEDWRKIKPQTACILILNGAQDFVFKFVTVQGNSLSLESLNPEYKPYTVEIFDVLEIWQFHSYQSTQMPEPYGEITQVQVLINEIRNDVKYLKGKV